MDNFHAVSSLMLPWKTGLPADYFGLTASKHMVGFNNLIKSFNLFVWFY